jgi:hypothetical protein
LIQVVEDEVKLREDGTTEDIIVKQKPVKSITCGYFHSCVILKAK